MLDVGLHTEVICTCVSPVSTLMSPVSPLISPVSGIASSLTVLGHTGLAIAPTGLLRGLPGRVGTHSMAVCRLRRRDGPE